MDNPKKLPITAISIGPGIRGIERGVERVTGRIDVLTYVEIEAFIIQNLVWAMEAGVLDARPIWSDVKTFPAEIFRNIVDWIFAGYPCQPFSNAGLRKGTEDSRHLFPSIEKTIRIIRPGGCFFENVRGHVSCGLPEVIESLERMGYMVQWEIFSAEETGASHKRERVFILAIRKDLVNSDLKRWFNVQEKNEQYGRDEERNLEVCKQSGYNIKRWTTESSPNDQLANYNESGLQIITCQEQRIIQNEDESFKRSEFGGVYAKAVARPGQVQHEWERPRTISYAEETLEPPLGCTANGYRFREDFLRSLGNSVYADTAELAFRTLLLKFNKWKK